MKREEFKNCALCDKGVAHDHQIMFYRIGFERFGLDPNAIRRQHGLEQMIGSPVIAHIMGLDEHLAVPIGDAKSMLICGNCMHERLPILMAAAED